ncbi:Transcription factor [Penicillium waksmanii]|uniref:Transcription factor n=1 Tax=Penicillium waksmanii TaxID=69791 RepID=UPI002548D42D|nr:Transcription factor [Penicillium waksmanii]KAJ5963077.1 Transcription factor [Penicillium waksmanii]
MPGLINEDMAISEDINHQFSDMDHSNGFLACGDSPESIVPEGRLIRLYYENFHSAHPILVPAALYERWKYQNCLHQVVKFIGSHYSVVLDNDVLNESTWLLLNQTTERTYHMVQAHLLYSIIMRARNETSKADDSLTQAIDIALELGMHREDFATTFSGGREHEAESLRRTWWELFIWEAYMATLNKRSNLRCSDVFSDVCLPCEESTYASFQSIPQPHSLASFRTRIFTEDEGVTYYSSFSYRIEAVRILARVLVLNSLPETHHDHLQAVANTLVSWLHHLPQQKTDIIDMYGNIDEMLFQAYFTIHYAAMLLHLPRGNLRPRFPDSMFSICPVTLFRLSPSLTRHVHDVKTIEASKKLSNLLSVRSSAQSYSPIVVFGSLLCGLVQLTAIHSHGPDCCDHHQNRIVLVLGCLKLLRSNWPLAQEAFSHLRNSVAQRTTITSEYSPFESRPKPQRNQRPNTAAIETARSLPVGDDAIHGHLSSRLLSEYLDPICGDSFPLFHMPDPQSFSDSLDHQYT